MENNENFVPEVGTEKAETPAEQSAPKLYTEEEMNAKANEIAGKRSARYKAKIEKEYARKYGDLEEVLSAGTGKTDVGEITDTFRTFYEGKGVEMPKRSVYSDKDNEILARAEADEIIRLGYDEVVDEVERLTALGADRMTDREKAVFKVLAEHRQSTERGKALSEIGVTEDVYNSSEFKAFAGKFKSDVPITEIYEHFSKTQPKKEIRTAGSMKSTATEDNGIKDFYTYEESLKFTKKDFDNNPQLFKAVCDSMTKW